MKDSLILCLISIFFFSGCINPQIKYDKAPIDPQSPIINKLLKSVNAETSDKSVIVFTSWFEKDTIKIYTGDELMYDKIMKTSPDTGLSSIIPISNIKSVLIKIESSEIFKIILNPKDFRKYKFVYVKRDTKKRNKFYLEYSNDWKRFM